MRRTSRAAVPISVAVCAIAALAPARAAPVVTPTPPTFLVGPDPQTSLEIWPAVVTSATGPRPVIVVLPGWGVPASKYSDVSRYLNARGYAVAVFSHGTENLDTWPQDWDLWAEGAIDRLELEALSPSSPLHKLVDPERLGIVGHSLGGAAATLIASYDRRVKAVALFGPNSADPSYLAAALTITAPLLTIDGSLDRLAPPDRCSDVVVANAASTDKASLVVANGSHKNCPAEFDEDFIRDSGRCLLEPAFDWPYWQWTWDWPIVPGVKPMHGDQQRAVAFPYLGAWLDRYICGLKDPQGWTDGRKADDGVRTGVLTRDFVSAAARKGTP